VTGEKGEKCGVGRIAGGRDFMGGEMGTWGGGAGSTMVLGGLNGALAVKDLQAGFRSDLIRGPAR
jgi:hypothetical protein